MRCGSRGASVVGELTDRMGVGLGAEAQPAREQIRPAIPEDVAAIQEVCAAAWRDTFAGLVAAERIEQVIAEYYNPDRLRGELTGPDGEPGWLVAEDRGGVIGAIRGGLVEPTAGEIFQLYVSPPRQRQGIGTRLLEAVTAQQLAQGAREQWLSVQRFNPKGLPFFQVRGFVPWDQRSVRRTNVQEQSPYVRLWRYI